ncbi:MAG: AAA family ATPase [Oscillospiraceae bacterium]|jgi:energy-coupling factor transporter ATP-binding protein EcfA2|nr:AAA family ATPase [Oscillospiraceae bacterium]
MITSVALKSFRGFICTTTVPLSRVTLLTGANGVGKTSVLEGLYCLFSEIRLDVAPLARYNRTIGPVVNQANGTRSIGTRPTYNYRLFWDECPTFGANESIVSAESDDGTRWQWEFARGKRSDLAASWVRDAGNMGMTIDDSADIALFKWRHTGTVFDGEHREINIDENWRRAQILTPDGGLYLLPPESMATSASRYLDFASVRAMPQELTYKTAQKLTKALQIINPHVTDIRISKVENGLSVILDGDKETTLGSIGNGAVTWASVLIALFELDEYLKTTETARHPVLILIDEIGAGIHYSVMSEIWSYLRNFAKQYPNVQFVTTSHSDDCVRAFCDAFSDTDDTGNVIRLHKSNDGQIVSTRYESSQ